MMISAHLHTARDSVGAGAHTRNPLLMGVIQTGQWPEEETKGKLRLAAFMHALSPPDRPDNMLCHLFKLLRIHGRAIFGLSTVLHHIKQ